MFLPVEVFIQNGVYSGKSRVIQRGVKLSIDRRSIYSAAYSEE